MGSWNHKDRGKNKTWFKPPRRWCLMICWSQFMWSCHMFSKKHDVRRTCHMMYSRKLTNVCFLEKKKLYQTSGCPLCSPLKSPSPVRDGWKMIFLLGWPIVCGLRWKNDSSWKIPCWERSHIPYQPALFESLVFLFPFGGRCDRFLEGIFLH